MNSSIKSLVIIAACLVGTQNVRAGVGDWLMAGTAIAAGAATLYAAPKVTNPYARLALGAGLASVCYVLVAQWQLSQTLATQSVSSTTQTTAENSDSVQIREEQAQGIARLQQELQTLRESQVKNLKDLKEKQEKIQNLEIDIGKISTQIGKSANAAEGAINYAQKARQVISKLLPGKKIDTTPDLEDVLAQELPQASTTKSPWTKKLEKELEAAEKRITTLERFLSGINGFCPHHLYFKTKEAWENFDARAFFTYEGQSEKDETKD